MWPALTARLGIAAAVCAACFWLGWDMADSRWTIRHQKDVIRMHEAGVEALNRNRQTLETYREDLAHLRARPPRSVYTCPDDLPGTAAGASDPGAPGASGGDRRDLGPVLLACRERLSQLNTLIETVK